LNISSWLEVAVGGIGALGALIAPGAVPSPASQPGTLGGFPDPPATDSARQAELRPRALALRPPPAQAVQRRPLRRGPRAGVAVAITFDACATRTHGYGFDRPVFDILKREEVPATIFVSGRWVEFHPDAMADLVATPLIEFGDHSYDHPHMAKLPAGHIGEEIDLTERALARYGKHSVAFRPPFGQWSRRVMRVVAERGLPAVLWDVVSGDPSAKTTTEGMIRTVTRKARPGSIIIFHINGRGHKTAEALPAILADLRARGFEFVPLSRLLQPEAAATEPAPAARPSAPPAEAAPPAPARVAAPLPVAATPAAWHGAAPPPVAAPAAPGPPPTAPEAAPPEVPTESPQVPAAAPAARPAAPSP
jgi:peptidoglycan/xylan/chitin deacetylase (PgdA/CDA1 family)